MSAPAPSNAARVNASTLATSASYSSSMQPRVMTDRERRGKLHRRRRQLRDVREQARLCEAPPETAAPVSDRLQKKERA